MQKNIRCLLAIAGAAAGALALMPDSLASLPCPLFKQLSAEWWQWSLSMPASVSPVVDTTGDHCMAGQRGDTWFLAGTLDGGTVARACTVPSDRNLFVPVLNSIHIDTPGTCGQGPDPLTIEELRDASAAFVDDATNVLVELDGAAIQPHRLQSKAFDVAVPEDNLLGSSCPGLRAGILGPAIDEGLYVSLSPLSVGTHTLHIHAEAPSFGFSTDVTYELTIVQGHS